VSYFKEEADQKGISLQFVNDLKECYSVKTNKIKLE